jgi:16S rRNA (cytidine1402-2'-O)-methyltransferase
MAELFVVATPIGNLNDVSERARRVLASVDRVLAEDTRHTGRLLQHLEIQRPLTSLHAHNEASRVEQVVRWLSEGQSLALVSDAGTPLVSDPGSRLVHAIREAGYRVTPIPGPSAVLAALVGSGLPMDRFSFLGFPARSGADRRRTLAMIAEGPMTTVLFESPERLVALLTDLQDLCADDREVCVARELTKRFETFTTGPISEVIQTYRDEPARGEVTVVVAPAPPPDPEAELGEAERLARQLLAQGRAPSRTAREVARQTGVSRNQAYELVQRVGSES